MFRKILENKPVDAIIITDPINIRYLSGYRGEGALYLSANTQTIITDSRYTEAAAKESTFDVIEENAGRRRYAILSDLIKKDNARSIGYEDEFMSCCDFSRYNKKVEEIGWWVPISADVKMFRRVKSEEEIAFIEKACSIADKAYDEICKFIKPGMTELDGAAELEYRMKRLGADGLSFSTIFAAGKNSSMPHAIPTSYKVQNGDFITMDFGCTYNGYCSDTTRTVAVGEPSEKQKLVYDTVLKAQLAGVKAAGPGLTGKEIDTVARNIISEAGFGENFGHALGHSIGLVCHEGPNFSQSEKTVIKKNMVLTVEPGIYIPGEFGVRIEDTVAITDTGCRRLIKSSKELRIL